ncbi:carbohydrate ABC transporter permease [Paenibacillus sp. Soil787]|uniref:carbohydrate ABC transporter permease n=1 Tax=Paenibacillus sp. Soil787 TaxID=1736411 RepID=UPI0007000C65|nr:sugar ABC transporter permease [Paenibacillus sp. Soil787]KRF42834.1 glycerol-3-phosphate ABC transporter permease [Paenibacillus sp. Soil787]
MNNSLAGIALKERSKPVQRVRRKRSLRWTMPWLYLLPAILSIGFWVYRPLLQTVRLSFYEWNMLPTSPQVWMGLKNYRLLFQLPDMSQALLNTLIYTVGVIPFALVIPLAIAIATDNIGKRSRTLYRALVFVPMIMAPVAVSAIWSWLMNPMGGLINKMLMALHLVQDPIRFFSDSHWAIWSVTFITGWKLIGFSTLIFSAALSGLNKEYIEAARIDRAGRWQIIWHVLLPLLSPTIMFMAMLSTLFAAEWSFSYINVLTQGGPMNSTTNIYYLLWTYGFKTFSVGSSSAAAVVVVLGSSLIALGFMKLSNKLSFYDN